VPRLRDGLAEAEIEYNDDPCDSVYVKFNVREDNGTLSGWAPILER
jgi:isoleucyl-tRNA synthetase